MRPEDWIDRWQQGRIGFHLDAINPWLLRFEELLAGRRRVLVPLCGKSRDLEYLADRGHEVVGVEISPLAAEALHAESGRNAKVDAFAQFLRWRSEGLTLLCGDVFDLERADVGTFDAIWDRAALVALDADERQRYVDELASLLAPAAVWLLVSLEYDPGEMAGPPFAVSRSEVQQLFASRGELIELEDRDALPDNPKFAERGLRALRERMYVLKT